MTSNINSIRIMGRVKPQITLSSLLKFPTPILVGSYITSCLPPFLTLQCTFAVHCRYLSYMSWLAGSCVGTINISTSQCTNGPSSCFFCQNSILPVTKLSYSQPFSTPAATQSNPFEFYILNVIQLVLVQRDSYPYLSVSSSQQISCP